MTLFIIGFALLLGLIITLEVKSRKREKVNKQDYLDILKEVLHESREQTRESMDRLEDTIYRKFAMLYAKGIDSVATIRLKEAKEKGYFDRIFFFEGAEYKFIYFHIIKDYEITIVASPVAPSINETFRRITIFKNGLFTALDFVKEEQILKQQNRIK